MAYKSVNELEEIDIQDAYITRFQVDENQITLELEGAKIEPSNSQNEMRVKSYAGPLVLRLQDAHIYQIFKEGYKYYDANNVLIEEKPDEIVSSEDMPMIIRRLKDNYIFALEAVNDTPKNTINNACEEETVFNYMLCVDIDEDDYWLKITFSKAIANWDKYMNRVQG